MQHLGFVLTPQFQIMGLTMSTVFEMANQQSGGDFYHIEFLSENGGLVPSSAGFAMQTLPAGRKKLDTLILVASTPVHASSPGLLRYLRRTARHARRVAAPCTGAFVLAEAGLLDGRRATTHWAYARALQARYPQLQVEDDRIFIADGPIWTSAGMTAAIDLALAMVEADLGTEVARAVARSLVMSHRRAGGQSQFSTLLELDAKSDRIQKTMEHARSHLRNELSVQELADIAHLSPRQFSRAFHAETGFPPAKAVEKLRVEAARLLLEQGRLTLESIAQETGFADPERMRRAFLRTLGQPPQALRRQARLNAQPLLPADPATLPLAA